MSTCEKCWGDAYLRPLATGKPQSQCYLALVEERKSNPCTPKEQADQFWDEIKQVDIRK